MADFAHFAVVAVVLVCFIPSSAADTCQSKDLFDDDYTYTYCVYGCCGLDDFQYCCSTPTKVIVGASVGTLVGIVLLVLLCCYVCARGCRSQPRTIVTGAAPAPIVFASSTSMQMGGGCYPPQPAQNFGHPGHSCPPPYEQATSTSIGVVNPGYSKY